MLVGIISDTHDNVNAVESAMAVFEDQDVDTVVHCGDVIAPPVIPFFADVSLHLVFGNNDGEEVGLRAAVAALEDGHCHGRFGVMEYDGLRLAALHGEDIEEVERLAASETFDVVCYGHHHETRLETIGDTTLLNPGGHFPTIPAEHRQVAILDTDTGEIFFEDV